MTKRDIEHLALFMGHTDGVHRSEYRFPDDVYQTAKICNIFLAVESGSVNFKGKTLDQTNTDLEENLLND